MKQDILDNLFLLSRDNIRFDKRFRLAACIVYRNKIISYGFNSIKTHPLQKQFGTTKQSIHLHAEIDAIKNALKKISVNQLSKSDLYIARSKSVNSKIVKAIAKPCLGCQKAIINFNIKNVFYTYEEKINETSSMRYRRTSN